MSKFVKKIVKTDKFKNGTTQTTISIKKKKDEFITMEEIEELQNDLAEKTEYYNVCIRGLNGVSWTTIKGYDQEFNDPTVYEYFTNKVEDAERFTEFYQLELYVYKNK